MSKNSNKTSTIGLVTALLVLLGCLGGGIAVIKAKPEVARETVTVQPRLVRAVTVSASPATLRVQSQGTVEARQRISLIPQVSGAVHEVSDKFVNGGRFQAGELILALDPRDYELAVIGAEAVVADAQQALETARAQSQLAQAEWQLLVPGGSRLPSELALRKPQLAGAEARLKSAEADLLKARLMLERTRILAPFDGMVSAREVALGQYVNAGASLSEFIAVDALEVRLPVPENALDDLDLSVLDIAGKGLPVTLSAMVGGSERQWRTWISRSEGVLDPRTRNLVLVASISGTDMRADDGATQLTLGQYVRAEIQGRQLGTVFKLPRAALHHGDQVYVVDADRRLRSRRVSVLATLEDSVLVGAELRDGEQVVTSPLAGFVDGMEVNLAGSDDEADTGEHS